VALSHAKRCHCAFRQRGSQYCSAAYQKLFTQHQLIGSMSKKGDCYDNAAMNRFDFKAMILTFHGERFLSRSDAKYQVFDYIEVYYNRKQLHSKLGYISPETFEAKKVA
jgi:putative transposase